jgi:hypothetical protein
MHRKSSEINSRAPIDHYPFSTIDNRLNSILQSIATGEPLKETALKTELDALKIRSPEDYKLTSLWAKDLMARGNLYNFQESVFLDDDGKPIKTRAFDRLIQDHVDACWMDDLYAGILAPVGSGKSLAIDTEVPTVYGFKRMGDLKTGDTVFDLCGNPCSVTWTSETQLNRKIYELSFSDGTSVRADADHRWLVWTADDLRNRYKSRKIKVSDRGLRTVTTEEMLKRGVLLNRKPNRDFRWRIPVGGPIDYKPKNYIVDPYVLGVWIGDGDQNRCVKIEGGHSPRPDKRKPHVMSCSLGQKNNIYGKTSLRSRLKDLGLLWPNRTKFIPDEYLLGSIEQRKNLLAGLLDTDGSTNGLRVEFCTKYERLAKNVVELVRSLGIRCGEPRRGKTKAADRYRVTFTPNEPVFSLRRKRKRQEDALLEVPKDKTRVHTRSISVVNIQKIESIPVRCISVDSPDASYRIGRSYLVTHNTVQLSQIRPLFEICKNQNLLVKIISATVETAQKRCEQLGKIIMYSQNFKRIWGHRVRPAIARHRSEEAWKKTRITVERSTGSIDGTVEAYGMTASAMGGRCHLEIFDDAIDDKSSILSAAMRDVARSKFEGQWMSRLFQGRKGRSIWVATRWSEDDLSGELMLNAKWRFLEIRVSEDFQCLEYDVSYLGTVLKSGTIELPYPFTPESLRQEYSKSGEIQFNRMFRQRPYSKSDRYFGYVETCFNKTITMNQASSLSINGKWPTIVGVDLSTNKRKGNAITVVSLNPKDKKKWLVDCKIGNWKTPDLGLVLNQINQAYNVIAFIIESNAQQEMFLDMSRAYPEKFSYGHKIVSFQTTKASKHDPVSGIRTMDIDFQNQAWVFPSLKESGHDDSREHVRGCGMCLVLEELLAYPIYPTQDTVMSTWFARSGINEYLHAESSINSDLTKVLLEQQYDDPGRNGILGMNSYGQYVSAEDDSEWDSW